MTHSVAVDRFEGGVKDIAVLVADDGTQINFPAAMLPARTKPGDVLTLSIERDTKATKATAAKTRQVEADLAKRDPGGDLKL